MHQLVGDISRDALRPLQYSEWWGSAVAVEPKIDGYRARYSYGRLWSRQDNTFNQPHIVRELRAAGIRDIDGELFARDYSYTASCIKAGRPVDLYVWDLPSEHGGYWERRQRLEFMASGLKHVHLVPYELASGTADLRRVNARHLSDGYEGSVVKLLDSHYSPGSRAGWYRAKPWHTAECKVVDYSDYPHSIEVVNPRGGRQWIYAGVDVGMLADLAAEGIDITRVEIRYRKYSSLYAQMVSPVFHRVILEA